MARERIEGLWDLAERRIRVTPRPVPSGPRSCSPRWVVPLRLEDRAVQAGYVDLPSAPRAGTTPLARKRLAWVPGRAECLRKPCPGVPEHTIRHPWVDMFASDPARAQREAAACWAALLWRRLERKLRPMRPAPMVPETISGVSKPAALRYMIRERAPIAQKAPCSRNL